MKNVLCLRTALILSGIGLTLGLMAGGSAAQQDLSGVQITPAKVEQDLSQRTFKLPIRLVNNEDVEQRISVSVSGLGHDLGGAPLYLEPAIATEAIQLSAAEMTLAPGASGEVIATGAIPQGERSLYAAVVAEFGPPGDAPETAVTSRSRVASLLLLRGPKPWKERIEVVDVSILPAVEKRGPLQVFAAAKNTGNVHVKPSGQVRLVKDGKTLDRVDLPGQNIIPDYARRLLGDWRPPKKFTGRVKLVATTAHPAARGVGYVDFTPQGELAVPGMTIGNLVARDEAGPLVEFVLTNSGTIPLGPTISLAITKDEAPIADMKIEQERMEPGDSEVIQWRPEGLEEGVYLISAEVRFREQLLDQAATGLKVEDKGLPVWVFLVGGGILLLLLMGLALFFRRRKKRDERKDPEESEPAEAA